MLFPAKQRATLLTLYFTHRGRLNPAALALRTPHSV